ncbi:MAG: HNH endonuclease [Deltaproteobacteria bacterium]|nr:HNH endonuclease [Deltaproteobacteria bacterium]
MSSPARRRHLVLAIVATDDTFRLVEARGERLWVGRCIFCKRAITVSPAGDLLSGATLEHILSRHHGGDDRVDNLALACRGCNHEKGMRHDAKKRGDARAAEVVEQLRRTRRERWRTPPS